MRSLRKSTMRQQPKTIIGTGNRARHHVLTIVEQPVNALRFGSPLRSNLLGTAARGTVGGQYPRPDE